MKLYPPPSHLRSSGGSFKGSSSNNQLGQAPPSALGLHVLAQSTLSDLDSLLDSSTWSPRSSTSSASSTSTACSSVRKWEQEMGDRRFQPDQNVVFSRDVIQMPLKVEDKDNEYVNLVLSQREFDMMAVHVPEYDEMRPDELVDLLTKLVKDSNRCKKRLVRSSSIGAGKSGSSTPVRGNNQTSSSDPSILFQGRVLELEYELSRLNKKLSKARTSQAVMAEENCSMRSRIQELEREAEEMQHTLMARDTRVKVLEDIAVECEQLREENEWKSIKLEKNVVANEQLRMENELLKDQTKAHEAELTRMRGLALQMHAEVTQLRQQLLDVRVDQVKHTNEGQAAMREALTDLSMRMREREAHLQESYYHEKRERQLMAEKYHELSGRIRVFCRMRPPRTPQDLSIMIPRPNAVFVEKGGKEFAFDRVFGPESSQEDVYEQIEPVVASFADGFNACIMAYGQTGAGKTHTMLGNGQVSPDLEGMIPRALKQVFTEVSSRQMTYKDSLRVSMIEIYNDQIRDLLSDDAKKGARNAYIKNESEIATREVNVWSDVSDILDEGNGNRNIASTSMNNESSRSHALVFLHLDSQHRESMELRKSTLCLVDLAGSERISRSQVEGDRLKETQHINKSLAALGDVVYALQHKSKHVPYRNSKLTFMLREMLSGQAKTLLMLQLSPDLTDAEETICSLNFGARVSQVQMGAVRTSVESGEIIKLKEEQRVMEQKMLKLESTVAMLRDECAKKQEELNEVEGAKAALEGKVRIQQDEIAGLTAEVDNALASSMLSNASLSTNAEEVAPITSFSVEQSDEPTERCPSSPAPSNHSTRSNRSPSPGSSGSSPPPRPASRSTPSVTKPTMSKTATSVARERAARVSSPSTARTTRATAASGAAATSRTTRSRTLASSSTAAPTPTRTHRRTTSLPSSTSTSTTKRTTSLSSSTSRLGTSRTPSTKPDPVPRRPLTRSSSTASSSSVTSRVSAVSRTSTSRSMTPTARTSRTAGSWK